jgi:hypothetical protein
MRDSLYTTWFGVYTTARYDIVRGHFSAIRSAMDTASVRFDCTCSDDYYAYVYPNQPYNIYLCNVFWRAPMIGTDSKAGTLIHEMSHFYVVASTDDWVYGQTGAKQLAITNPARAVTNADNHEYFAEDSPAVDNDTVLVNPVLTPTPGTVCATDWYKLSKAGFGGTPMYLTLNTNIGAQATNSGTWTPAIPKNGHYKVEAYIGSHGSILWSCPTKYILQDTSRARYRIYYSGGNVARLSRSSAASRTAPSCNFAPISPHFAETQFGSNSSALPKPIPGSTMSRDGSQPARSAWPSAVRRSSTTSRTTSS